MKIDLPHCEHMVQVLVRSPAGECVKVFDSSHKSFEMKLPEDVREDEIEVQVVRLDERGLAVGEMSYLKEAIIPEVAQSPPDESYCEKVIKEVAKPIDLSKKARKRQS